MEEDGNDNERADTYGCQSTRFDAKCKYFLCFDWAWISFEAFSFNEL